MQISNMKLMALMVFLTTLSCGYERGLSSLDAASSGAPVLPAEEDTNLRTLVYQGFDAASGKPCVLTLQETADGTIEFVSLEGVFIRNYPVPMPLSGLYGKYHWSSLLTRTSHLVEAYEQHRSLLGDADVVRASGLPLFQNSGKSRHKLVVKPALMAPDSVSYEAKQQILGIVPFVIDDMTCNLVE